MQNSTNGMAFSYDHLGLRTQKTSTDRQTNATITTQYVYNGSLLVAAKISNGINMYFLYDATGEAIGFDYDDNGTVSRFYYQRLITGEIAGIISRSGTQQVEYLYDAWGNILSVSGTLATTVGYYNPLKYKGYVYDEETKLYYLQSRYYDPQVTRFLNGDGYVSTGQGANGSNMFAYCGNNPVNRSDTTGEFFIGLLSFAKAAASQIGQVLKALAPVYAGMAQVSLADGPALFVDAVMGAAAVVVTIGAVVYGTYAATKSIPIAIANAEAKAKAESKAGTKDVAIPSDTVIYRWPERKTPNVVSYTPSERDLGNLSAGLSFSTIPMPGSTMTTIEAINSTGILYAVPDGSTHVSVYPVGGTLASWRATGRFVMVTNIASVCVKWDGI